jgi:hypothetical protein
LIREPENPFDQVGMGWNGSDDISAPDAMTGDAMANDRRVRRDSACVIDADGSISAAALHEALTEGVDDRQFRVKTRVKLLREGVPAADLDRLLPKLNDSDLNTFQWRFQRWTGAPVPNTHGKKPLIDFGGVPLFAEVAMIQVLKQQGYENAVWVDSWRTCFRNAMPPAQCRVPAFVLELHTRVRNQNEGRWAGCFDLMAWTGDVVSFVELKWKGHDCMHDEGWRWVENALRAGVSFERFSICEWEFE